MLCLSRAFGVAVTLVGETIAFTCGLVTPVRDLVPKVIGVQPLARVLGAGSLGLIAVGGASAALALHLGGRLILVRGVLLAVALRLIAITQRLIAVA